MNLPTAQTLYRTIDDTWPAAEVHTTDEWTLRFGAGGGSRVSAATANTPVSIADIATAETAMVSWGQSPLFMIREGDEELDQQLSDLGFQIKDPVTMYAAQLSEMDIQRPPPVTSFEVWPPLNCQKEIWQDGGIGSGRFDVMERANGPKTTLLGRLNDTPAGTTFVGISGHLAMMHALEVKNDIRRKGLARMLTNAACLWGRDQGAKTMTLVTTTANEAANRLYSSLGMQVVGHYHYRIKSKDNAT